MTDRKPLIAANWKMNAPPPGWDGEDSPYNPREDIDVVLFPSLLDIHVCLEKFLTVGGQYGRSEKNGAFTGDISMQLLAAHGCTWVLCGHSERRKHHHESDQDVAAQAAAAIEAGLHPVICIGETADEREMGQAKEVVTRQLKVIEDFSGCVIAYEPVWAIGTGKNATAQEAREMHALIRSLLPADKRDEVRIIYGGSVKPENAGELLAQEDIDGLLVGGSSLDPVTFGKIVEIAAAR